MKLEKNKIVFTGVIVYVVLFIGVYSMMIMGDEDEATLDSNQIPVPELEDEQAAYESKLEALDDLKEVRETNAPSIYDERLLDSAGVYDPDLLDKEKMRIVDSIYNQGRINYTDRSYRSPKKKAVEEVVKKDSSVVENISKSSIQVRELGLEHQLFFASHPVENASDAFGDTSVSMLVEVQGMQTVRKDYRLQMRLLEDVMIRGRLIPRNTAVYGFVSFKPNRVMITIEDIGHLPVKFRDV